MSKQTRNFNRIKKHLRTKRNIFGTATKPRLNVFKSLKHFEAQLINDVEGKTIAHSSTISLKMEYGGNIESSIKVGQDMAKKIKELGIKEIVFDRGGFIYHGRVKSFAEEIRKEGVKF